MKAQKARAKLEEDIKDLQSQYDTISRGKNEVSCRKEQLSLRVVQCCLCKCIFLFTFSLY